MTRMERSQNINRIEPWLKCSGYFRKRCLLPNRLPVACSASLLLLGQFGRSSLLLSCNFKQCQWPFLGWMSMHLSLKPISHLTGTVEYLHGINYSHINVSTFYHLPVSCSNENHIFSFQVDLFQLLRVCVILWCLPESVPKPWSETWGHLSMCYFCWSHDSCNPQVLFRMFVLLMSVTASIKCAELTR